MNLIEIRFVTLHLDDIFKIGVEVDSDLKRLAYEKPPDSLDIEHGAFLDLYSLTLGQGDRTPGLKRLAKDYCGRELGKCDLDACAGVIDHSLLTRQDVPSVRLGGDVDD